MQNFVRISGLLLSTNRLYLVFSCKQIALNFEVWDSLNIQFLVAEHRSEVLSQTPSLTVAYILRKTRM